MFFNPRAFLGWVGLLALAVVAVIAFYPWDSPLAPRVTPRPEQVSNSGGQGQAVAVSESRLGAVAEFQDWSGRYLRADAQLREQLEEQGLALAAARRPVFKQLIRDDPREALAQAVPMVVRQKLPSIILAQLEDRVNVTGVLRVYRGRTLAGEPVSKHVAELQNGKTYSAHVYGRRAEKVTWTPSASLNGVALDSDFAINEDPMRVLEAGEVPNQDKPAVAVCPVSGRESVATEEAAEPVPEDTPVVETAEEVVYLCNGTHVVLYRETLIMAEGSTGGPTAFTGILPSAPTPSMGVVRVIYIPATYADQSAVPATEATAYQMMRDVSDYYATNSYGRLTLLTTVTPPVKLPHTENWYIQRDTSNGGDIDGEGISMAHAREEAKKLGYDYTNFDCTVMRHNGGPGSYGGLGGGSTVWIRSDGAKLTAHEVGHAFGLGHSNFWDTAGTSAIGAGTNQEYGDVYDVMGGGNVPNEHYNSQAKSQIRWLPRGNIQDITQSGPYRLYAYDQPTLEPTKRYALNITKDAQRVYWGEVRQVYTDSTTRPWADKGLLLGWRYPSGSGGNLQRIDTTPGSPFGKDDAAISLGRTFSDTDSGIHITTVAVNTDTTPKSVDVQVNLGQFSTNQAPTLSLAASAEVVPVNATVTFTATANDADGDELAFSWQHFGDTNYKVVDANAPVITRTFTNAGSYLVACTVSDMKGGTATRHKLIIVGNGNNRFIISGRVTQGGQGLADVVVTANGANGVITDSDGYYFIPNLTATTYSMTPLLYGYSFSELFNNNVTVGPNFIGADFDASASARVTLTVDEPEAAENVAAVPARFTLTRTGDLSADLIVNMNPVQGGATRGTDYQFSPNYVTGSQGFITFTIPAGEASLAVDVVPIDDNAEEGPETVLVELGQSTAYILGANTRGTLVIQDNDTTLPKVSLTSVNASTLEGSGEPVVLKLTRSGPVDAALTVPIALSGTASMGPDYALLISSMTIPAGADSKTFQISPVDDNIAEALETVIVKITSGVNHLADPLANAVTVSIVDDDVQIVNVAAGDAQGAEVNLALPDTQADTASFIVTRSGDISKDLTVYYAVSGTYNNGVPATHGVDYDALPGSVVIPAGQTRASITILPRYDELGEGTENVLLRLGSGSTLYQGGEASSAVITILDHPGDTPQVDVIQTANAAEPSTNGNFRITARGAGTGPLTVNYTITGTATSGVDFIALSGSTTLTLADGVPVVSNLSVVPLADSLPEEWETVTLTITPSSQYQSFGPTSSATLRILDDEQPTVFVDAQVGTSGNAYTATEGTTSNPTKFWISRDGPQNVAVTVNYTLSGTATNGVDYNTLSGTVVIPSGTQGVDVPVVITNDSTFEGTETIILNLSAGSYAIGNGSAKILIADNETSTQLVSFDSSGAVSSENVGQVSIPVSLTNAATTPTTVDYEIDGGVVGSSRSGMNSTTFVNAPPYWVRAVRDGSSMTSFISFDGTTWRQVAGSVTNNMSTSNYLVALVAGSGTSGQAAAVTFDNVSITNLALGASASASPTHLTIGTTNPASTSSLSNGTYTFSAGGPGFSSSQSSDNICTAYFTINGTSPTCTITARVVSMSGGGNSTRAGVMFRESTGASVRYYASLMALDNRFYIYSRNTPGSNNTYHTQFAMLKKPAWVRLQRVGETFTASMSNNGSSWITVGASQTVALSSEMLVGLAVSARLDGSISDATFDNVSITPAPPGGIRFAKRSVGFVLAEGSHQQNAGTHALSGSGASIGGNVDECEFAAMPISGDFTLIARVTSQDGGTWNAQAGVMARESAHMNGRMFYCGSQLNEGGEFIYRLRPLTDAAGSGLDHDLSNGVLHFGIGEQTKNIVFNVIDDAIHEDTEKLNIALRNPYGAQLASSNTVFTYTIEDNDAPSSVPYVGFASAASSGAESSVGQQVLVTLSSPATTSISVEYAMAEGTATNADFISTSGTLQFAAGETVKSIPLTLVNDSLAESDETFSLTLANPTGARLGSLDLHTFTIIDDDKPVITLVATDPLASEANLDPGEFTFYRTGPTDSSLTVYYTVGGTASTNSDRTGVGTSVTFQPGFNYTRRLVTPLQDTANEGPETTILTISVDAAYIVGSPSSATVTIADDDRSTVTLVASDPDASETSGNPGEFTLTRTDPITSSLTVNLTRTGTATNGTDYTSIGSTVTFTANQSSRTIAVVPVDDSITEGREVVTLQLASGSYDIGGEGYDDVSIEDNDSPPVVFISGPTAQGPLIAEGNGIVVTATATDDGFPTALAYAWSCVSGPGQTSFETPTALSTAVSFTQPGTYVLRCSVTDTQFTVSDQVTVVVGASLAGATWITQDLGPTTARRGSGLEKDGVFTLQGTGAGYASANNDTAHVMVRQADGDSSVVVRLTALTGATTPLAGVTMRETLMRGSKRVVLGYLSGTGLQMRTRSTVSTSDTLTASVSGIVPPVWLKLEREAATGNISGSYAPDVGGSPGAWVPVGTASALYTTPRSSLGLTTTSNTSSALATATFEQMTLTPAASGPALMAEESNVSPNMPGTFSESNGTYTIAGSPTGVFYGWQFYGDLMVTAKHASATSGAGSATSGICIRESNDGGARVQVGRIPTSAYSGYFWTSIAGGSNTGVPSFTQATRWVRLIRRGNTITGFHAPDVGGSPGTWAQIGQPQTVIMTTPVMVGFSVNNNSGVGYNTVTFTNLSIVPLNKAPVISMAASATYPFGFNDLDASVTDDGFPLPAQLTTQWSHREGPVAATFTDANAVDTEAFFGAPGNYRIRLQADDSSVVSFRDWLLQVEGSPFEQWQAQHWEDYLTDPNAAEDMDPDFDGQVNLLEYAFGIRPKFTDPSPVEFGTTIVGEDEYLCISVPKNPDATDVTFTVQASNDPGEPMSWSSDGLVTEVNTSTQLRVRDHVPLGSQRHRFMRVKVSR